MVTASTNPVENGTEGARSAGAPADATIKVWDPLVRIVHWSLVGAFALAWLTAEEFEQIHNISGYAVAGLVALRFVWGFVGTRHARFASFVRGPRAVLAYLTGLVKGSSRRHLGHNPAGAAMAVALLIALTGTTTSGMALLAAEEGEGPFAGWLAPTASMAQTEGVSAVLQRRGDDDHHDEGEAERNEEWLEDTHEAFANATLALVILHVLGVFASGLAHRENLVRGMITGRKRADG